MKKKNLVVFDIDGTLTDSVTQHQEAFTEALAELGVEKINSDLNHFKHHTDSYISKEIYQTVLGLSFSEEKKSQFENILTSRIVEYTFNEISGAKSLIANIVNKPDFGISFATGSLRRAAEHKLQSIGIEFEEWQLVSSDDLYERERIVSKAIENSKINYEVDQFNRIISVGDGVWDVQAAQNLDLEFVGIGLANKEKLLGLGARIVCEDLKEFESKIVFASSIS